MKERSWLTIGLVALAALSLLSVWSLKMHTSCSEKPQEQDLPIACNLSSAALKDRQTDLKELLKKSEGFEKLEQGFAFSFKSEEGLEGVLMKAIQAERACCPFLSFQISLGANRGPIRVAIEGPEGTKQFLSQLLEMQNT